MEKPNKRAKHTIHNDCQLDIVRYQPYGEQRDEAGEKCLNCGLNKSQELR